MLPLADAEFEKQVARIQALKIPAISGYGFLPAELKVVGPELDRAKVDEALGFGLGRAQRLGLKVAVYGNLPTHGRSVPEGFAKAEAWKQMVEFGKRAVAEAGRRGMTVLFKPMPARGGVLVNTVAEPAAGGLRVLHGQRGESRGVEGRGGVGSTRRSRITPGSCGL